MKTNLFCLALVILLVNAAQAQKINLVNTTWKVYYYYKESGNKSWNIYSKVTFLRNGKVKVEGDNCQIPADWRLVGNKLSFDGTGCGVQIKFLATVKGNQVNGNGEATWKALPIIVQLKKE